VTGPKTGEFLMTTAIEPAKTFLKDVNSLYNDEETPNGSSQPATRRKSAAGSKGPLAPVWSDSFDTCDSRRQE
jgi:hypothetical protein